MPRAFPAEVATVLRFGNATSHTPDSTAIVLLAAGLSQRFGPSDKLLAPLRDRPLVTHAAAMLAATRLPRFAVVSSPRVADLLDGFGFTCVDNPRPADGLGASLGCVVPHLDAFSRVLVALGDMPFVGASHLNALLEAPGVLVASRGDGYRGPPLVVDRSLLAAPPLGGEAGLRPLLHHATLIDAPAAELRDIDTEADLVA